MKLPASLFTAFIATLGALPAADLPAVSGLDPQPLIAQTRRLIDAAQMLGVPFSAEDIAALDAARNLGNGDETSARIQAILDPRCLFVVTINPEMRVKVAPGPAKAELVEQGWRSLFIKVVNESGTTAPLNIFSPQAQSAYRGGAMQNASDKRLRTRGGAAAPIDAKDVWLDLQSFDAPPMLPALGGLRLEYRIVSLYTRDAGKREATFAFDVGQGTQDLGFRGETSVLFTAQPARTITLRVRDEHGKPTTASFEIRDRQRRVYPSPAKRLAPDFGFHPQIYRADGETVRLPDGDYTIDFARGPESVAKQVPVKVGTDAREVAFQVERWIDPAQFGWWSGDHHIHAAGCAHYTKPDRRRSRARHDAALSRRGFEGWRESDLGAVLRLSKAILHRRRTTRFPRIRTCCATTSKCRGFGSHRVRASLPAALARPNVSRRRIETPLADARPQHAALGEETRRARRTRAFGLGAESARSEDRRARRCRPSTASARNEYIVDVTHTVPGPDGTLVPAVDFISTVDTPCAVGTEHLVSHAQRRLPHAHQRRDGFPVHLRRARGPRALLCEAAVAAGPTRTGARAFARDATTSAMARVTCSISK